MLTMSQGCIEVVSFVSRLCGASSGAQPIQTQHVAFEAGLSPNSSERLGDVISRFPHRTRSVQLFPLSVYSSIPSITMADTKKTTPTKEGLDKKRDVPFSR